LKSFGKLPVPSSRNFFKELVVIMKELTKNQQFRVGSLSWFFDVFRTPAKGQNLYFDFENQHHLPLIITGSFTFEKC
jgi:hypothetical protein